MNKSFSITIRAAWATYYIKADPKSNIRWYQILEDLMLFCQVWIARRAFTSNLAKPQTFPLEKLRGSYRGLKWSLAFWMSLYKD